MLALRLRISTYSRNSINDSEKGAGPAWRRLTRHRGQTLQPTVCLTSFSDMSRDSLLRLFWRIDYARMFPGGHSAAPPESRERTIQRRRVIVIKCGFRGRTGQLNIILLAVLVWHWLAAIGMLFSGPPTNRRPITLAPLRISGSQAESVWLPTIPACNSIKKSRRKFKFGEYVSCDKWWKMAEWLSSLGSMHK